MLRYRNYSTSEGGTSLIETAFTLPIMLTLSMGLIDLGRYLNTMYSVSRVAYETARYASGLSGLTQATTDPRCNPDYLSTTPTVQGQVRARVTQLLDTYKLTTNDTQLEARTGDSCDRVLVLTIDTATTNSLEVIVSVDFYPLFPLLRSLKAVRAKATSPYLFSRPTNLPYQRGTT